MSAEDKDLAFRRDITIEISGADCAGKTTIAVIIARHLAAVFEENGVLVPITIKNNDGDYLKVFKRVNDSAIHNKLGSAFSNLDAVRLVDGRITSQSYIGSALPDMD